MELDGNTLELSIQIPDILTRIERALSLLEVEKVTAKDMLAGGFGHISIGARRWHKDHSWSLLAERIRDLP